MVKKKLEIPFWIADGFMGILALVIYNFVLYVLVELGVGGIIKKIEDAMGYFLLKSFIDLEFSPISMVFGLAITFTIAFVMGAGISKLVRNQKKYHGKTVF